MQKNPSQINGMAVPNNANGNYFSSIFNLLLIIQLVFKDNTHTHSHSTADTLLFSIQITFFKLSN